VKLGVAVAEMEGVDDRVGDVVGDVVGDGVRLCDGVDVVEQVLDGERVGVCV
jgi:hypothetical protein